MDQKQLLEFELMKKSIAYTKKTTGDNKKELKEINKKFADFNIMMTKLTGKLFKDEDTGEEGMFNTVGRNSIRLDKQERLFLKLLVFFMAAGIAMGYAMAVINQVKEIAE
jgi:hypothetical protein